MSRPSRPNVRPAFLGLAALFLVLQLSACDAGKRDANDGRADTVIMVSLDGFWAEYLNAMETPTLKFLAETGVWAKEGMLPVFPSQTFPNHYAMATGLYPERNGMVANTILDRESGKRFTMSDRAAIEDPSWWEGEPIWVTAENQDVTTATFYWVGSEAPVKGVQPTYWRRFDASIPIGERIDQVLAWLDLPEPERPGFIGFYFETIDSAGHTYGTEAPETAEAVADADHQIGRLLEGLRQRGLENETNIIVVSDHGMADRSPSRVMALDDYIDLSQIQIVTTTPFLGLNVPGGRADAVEAALSGASPHLQVWTKNHVPERFRYGHHPNIPDVVGLVEEGWTLYRTRASLEENRDRLRGATHGYDPSSPSMRALFIANGPAFRSGIRIDPFENIHIYEMLARILQIDPAPNDGDPAILAPILNQ